MPDNDLRVQHQISTETTTCICVTGKDKELLVTGCHSGNLNFYKTQDVKEHKSVYLAHTNLIRVLLSLESLGHEFFLSADVCGVIKVWQSSMYSKLEKKKRDINSLSQ